MVTISLTKLIRDYTKSAAFPFRKSRENLYIARTAIPMFIEQSLRAAAYGNYITTARRGRTRYMFLAEMLMEKPRQLRTQSEKNQYVMSYRKFGHMFSMNVDGLYLGRTLFDFIPEKEVVAIMQDVVNSDLVYALTDEKSTD